MRPSRIATVGLALVASVFSRVPIGAQSYPAIGSLGPDDIIYAQQQEELAQSYAALRSAKEPPELQIYSYIIPANIDLASLSTRFDLPYASIATLNGLDRTRSFLQGERILVPSTPGIFASTKAGSDLDLFLSYRDTTSSYPVTVHRKGATASLRFYPGATFSPEERALFLGLLYRFPLPSAFLTKSFGMRERRPGERGRVSPTGIDFAASQGVEVYAVRDGLVSDTGVDEILGQYIVVTHDGGWSTLYGHLSVRRVQLNEKVESGMILGNVGSTGYSAGSRLLFEVYCPGVSPDVGSIPP
jgi:murein DD-endopeptidase MepM/ murein hydrolase activator NlpD